MFKHKHDKPPVKESENVTEKSAEKPHHHHHFEAPKLLKKGSITRFLPSFSRKSSSFALSEDQQRDADNKRGSDAVKQANSSSEITKKPSVNTSPDGLADGSSTPRSITPRSVNTGATTPLKSVDSFSNGGSTRKIPSVSLDPSGIPPALQNRDEQIPSRPPAMSIGGSIIDRYWHLSDVLEDRNVALTWRQRALMLLDIAKGLKRLHQLGVAHGRLLLESILVGQDISCKIQDTGSLVKTTDATQMQRDVLFFGAILVQVSLHQVLDIGGAKPRRSMNFEASQTDVPEGVPEERFADMKSLFSKTLLEEDISELADSWQFGEALSEEIRALTSFRPKEGETVPDEAIKSFEELAVQCCSAMAMNRPEADAIEDWLAAIVDMIGGIQQTTDDRNGRDKVFWALQSNENEILGDVVLADESDVVTGKTKVEEQREHTEEDEAKKDNGYETDDSFMPPDTRQRRQSRLSMFIEENDKTKQTETTTALKGGDDDEQKKKLKKRGNSRMSIKPTAMNIERFAGIHRRTSSTTGLILTPSQCRSRFDKQERLSREEIMNLLAKAEELLRDEPNLPVVLAPVTVVGDIHGQYFDLVNLIDLAGPPGSTRYLFLGDYVDRGDWSCEVLFYILSMKVAYPGMVTMIRGNHECDAVSSYFGFKEEVESKYGRPVFYRCLALFQSMPVGAVLDTGGAGRFLCVHGGISPHVTSLDQFDTINRFQEPGMNGFLCDVLWSDPIKDNFDDGEHARSLGDFLSIDYVSNPARGCAFRYGYSAILKFLATNRLVAIIRAHEVMQEGFRYHFQTITGGGKGQARIMPPVITVFSAPNYLGTYGNRGAFLKVSSAKDRGSAGGGFKPIDLLEPVQFTAVAHPVPLVLESESQHQKNTIETACPYMPTTFDSFVSRVLEFVNGEDLDEDELVPAAIQEEPERTLFDIETVTKAPGMEHRRKESVEKEAAELRQGLAQKVNIEMQGADLLKSGLLLTQNRRNSLVALREKKGVSSLIAQFSKAAAADGINEMHPALVQEKMTQAKKKLDSVPVRETTNSVAGSDEGLMGGGGGRRTVVANKKPKEEGGRKTGVLTKKSASSLRGAAMSDIAKSESSAVSAPSTTPAPQKVTKQDNGQLEVEVDFSEQEIIALQMLYLMIDRGNLGTIKSKELSQWSAADGATISDEDAELCIEALDLDEDGGVGFTDYLAFAARLKLKYEKDHKRVGMMKPF